jgi:hypothetical protein
MNVIFYPDKNASNTSRLPEASHNNGYWAILDNPTLHVYDITSETHIKFIIENPELFNLTYEKIKKTYEDFNEPINLEGKAREALILYALSLGWIRVRHYVGRNDYWSLQCDDSKKRKRAMQTFCYWAIKNEVMTSRDDLIIVGVDNNEDYEKFDFKNGGAGTFLPHQKKVFK